MIWSFEMKLPPFRGHLSSRKKGVPRCPRPNAPSWIWCDCEYNPDPNPTTPLPMASDFAVSVEGLSKCYRLAHQTQREENPTLRDQIVRHAQSLARKTRDMSSGQATVQVDTVEDCLGKMKGVGQSGRTIILGSHDVSAINQLCDLGIYLKDGTPIAHSSIQDAVAKYAESGAVDAAFSQWPEGLGTEVIPYLIKACDQNRARRFEFSKQEQITVSMEIDVESALPEARVAFRLVTSDSTGVFTSQGSDFLPAPAASVAKRQELFATIPGGYLNEAGYCVTKVAHVPNMRILFSQENPASFKVNSVNALGADGGHNRMGVARPRLDWDPSLIPGR